MLRTGSSTLLRVCGASLRAPWRLLLALAAKLGSDAARASARGLFEGRRIGDLIPAARRSPPTVSADELLGEALTRMRALQRFEVVVIDSIGVPVGVLRAGDLKLMSARGLWALTAGELMARLPVRHVVAPSRTGATDAIERAARAEAEYVIVIAPTAERHNNLVGLVAADDITRAAEQRRMQRLQGSPSRARASPAS